MRECTTKCRQLAGSPLPVSVNKADTVESDKAPGRLYFEADEKKGQGSAVQVQAPYEDESERHDFE